MRFLILFLALACSSQGQTLKWTATPPTPPFNFDRGVDVFLLMDAAGNLAVIVDYYTGQNNTPVGSQLLWYSAAGKLLKSEAFTEPAKAAGIVSVSQTCLMIVTTDGVNAGLRKYTRRGALILTKDTPLSLNEGPLLPGNYAAENKIGFFTLTYTGNNLTTIKRYLR